MGQGSSTYPAPPPLPCPDVVNLIASDLTGGEVLALSRACRELRGALYSLLERMKYLEDYGGNVNFLKWFVNEYGIECTETALKAVAKNGNLDALKWMHFEKGCLWNEGAFYGAIQSGNLDMVKYLVEQKCPYDLIEATRVSCGVSIEMFELMKSYGGFKWKQNDSRANIYTASRCLVEAARNGKIDILNYFKKSYSVLFDLIKLKHSDICSAAALHGNVSVLEWLRNEKFVWNEWTFALGVRGGDGKVVEYLLQNQCPKDAWSCYEAAYKGNKYLLEMLRSNGTPWDEFTIIGAKRGGYDYIAIWAIENDCPYDNSIDEYFGLPPQKESFASLLKSGYWRGIVGRTVIDYSEGTEYYGGSWIRILHPKVVSTRMLRHGPVAKFEILRSETDEGFPDPHAKLRYEL